MATPRAKHPATKRVASKSSTSGSRAVDAVTAVTTVARPAPLAVATGRTADVRDAALTLFAKLGYHGTSMKDIAAALRMRAPSLYNHVAAKQDLLRDIAITTHQRADRELRAALASSNDVVEQLRRVTEVHVRFHTKHPREWRVSSRELEHLDEPARSLVLDMRHDFETMMIGVLERGVREGRFSVSSPRLTTYALFRMSSGVALWYREGGPFSDSEIAYYFGELALRMVGAEESAPGDKRSPRRSASPDAERSFARRASALQHRQHGR